MGVVFAIYENLNQFQRFKSCPLPLSCRHFQHTDTLYSILQMTFVFPDDLLELILAQVRADRIRLAATLRIQTAFRGYRIRLLMLRFLTMRYLWHFRIFNPSAAIFFARARL